MRAEKYIRQWKWNYILFYAMLYMAICLVLANLMLCSQFMLPLLLLFPLYLCCIFTFSIRNALLLAGCEKEGHEQGIAFYTFLIEHELMRQVTKQRLIPKSNCWKKKTPEELLACNSTIRVSPKSAKVIITLFRIVLLLLYLVCCIILIILFASTVKTVKIPNISIVLFLVALILVIPIIIANLRLIFFGDKQYLKVRDRVCCAFALLVVLCFVLSVAFTTDYRNKENLKPKELEKFQSSFLPKETIPEDSVETYYLAIYQYLGNEGTCEFASNAKGEMYAFWEVQTIEEDRQQGMKSQRLVYDRKSANGLATLIVHYGVVEFGEGDQYRKEEKMLDEYAVRDSDKAIFSSGKTSWEMVGSAEYREVTGE